MTLERRLKPWKGWTLASECILLTVGKSPEVTFLNQWVKWLDFWKGKMLSIWVKARYQEELGLFYSKCVLRWCGYWLRTKYIMWGQPNKTKLREEHILFQWFPPM